MDVEEACQGACILRSRTIGVRDRSLYENLR